MNEPDDRIAAIHHPTWVSLRSRFADPRQTLSRSESRLIDLCGSIHLFPERASAVSVALIRPSEGHHPLALGLNLADDRGETRGPTSGPGKSAQGRVRDERRAIDW